MKWIQSFVIVILMCEVLFAQSNSDIKHELTSKNLERRTALIIGNSNYENSPLRNPINDAKDIASLLKKYKFKIELLVDADKRQMINSIRKFGKDLRNGGVGLFYYAGHGMQVNRENYIIPIKTNIEEEHEVPLESVNVNRILGYMDKAGNRLNLVILDACRDNPFSHSFRSSTRGLIQMDAPRGTLIAYATSPGKTAADGKTRNGVYTKYLLEEITTPNLEVGQMFRKIRAKVRKETGGSQIPWESTSLEGSFYFNYKKNNSHIMDYQGPTLFDKAQYFWFKIAKRECEQAKNLISFPFWEDRRIIETQNWKRNCELYGNMIKTIAELNKLPVGRFYHKQTIALTDRVRYREFFEYLLSRKILYSEIQIVYVLFNPAQDSWKNDGMQFIFHCKDDSCKIIGVDEGKQFNRKM